MSHHWDHISALFEAALTQPPGERTAWLKEACGEDSALRNEVERMLRAHERIDGILEYPIRAHVKDENDWAVQEDVEVPHVGPYRLMNEIGRGGMGIVYKAHDPRLERLVALKFLSPPLAAHEEALARFETEAQTVAVLDHPNICTIYDVGRVERPSTNLPAGLDPRDLYLAMAYYPGPTLEEKIEQSPLSIPEALDLALQVADGLDYAHNAGIIHRDVKPSNLILTNRGTVKILDFGIAKLEDEGTQTETEKKIGTVAYMAPEQVRGDAVDARTDLWALGIVLYQLLTDQHPFGTRSESALLTAILRDDPASIKTVRPDCPESLDNAVRTALAKNPEQRYASATELIAALDALQTPDPSHDVSAPRSTASSSASLPAPLTSFVGRESEVQTVQEKLAHNRLVTLTGPAGTGKTRLAVQVASRIRENISDGVFFVPLAPVTAPDRVAPAVAQALDLDERPTEPITQRLVNVLQSKEVLLVLDNFEQVISAAPLISDLLGACPRLHVLTTSRKALRLSGEREFPVPPLDVPPAAETDAPDSLKRYPAVDLLAARASAVRPDFSITEANAGPVAELCRRLDGLPLAIELAAARLKSFSPSELLTRLGRRLDLLKGGPRDRPVRHQTLRQAIAWSYDLLDGQEQAFFRRVAIFVGGCTLQAADTVANAYEPLDLEVDDGVSRLVRWNLLRREDGVDGGSRYVMLEMIRAYGLEQLQAEGELAATQQAHARHFLSLANTAKPHLTGPNQGYWLDRLEAEHENIRSALSWAKENRATEMGLELGAAMWRFWAVRDRLREGYQELDGLLDQPEAQVPTESRARALNAAGTLLHELSDFDKARSYLKESLQIWRETEDQRETATTLNNLGWIAVQTSEYDRAEALSEEALSLSRALDSKRDIALSLNNLGWVSMYRGAFGRARTLYEKSLDLRRERTDRRGTAFALTNLGWAERYLGNYDRADDLLSEALEILQQLNDNQLIAWNFNIKALVLHALGTLKLAATTGSESVARWREVGNKEGLAFALCTLATVRNDQGCLESAATCVDEAVPLIRAIDNQWDLAWAFRIQGSTAHEKEDVSRATELYGKSLTLWAEIGAVWGVVTCFERIAYTGNTDTPRRTARLLAAAEGLRTRIRAPRPPNAHADLDGLRSQVEDVLGTDVFSAQWNHGRSLSLDDAVSYALKQVSGA